MDDDSDIARPHDPAARAASRAAAYIEAHLDEDIPLARLAREVGHLQRSFTRLFGHSPKQHQTGLRVAVLKRRLRDGEPVSAAAFGSGFGSSRGVYEAATPRLGMPPATYRAGGPGLTIRYAFAPSPIGLVLVGVTDVGVCAVMLGDHQTALTTALEREFQRAELVRDDDAAGPQATAVASYISGSSEVPEMALDFRGTDFQRRVWTALTRIPSGSTATYADVACAIGAPTACRAVANACGGNHIAVLVPCHRVVRTDGGLGGYKWGIERKERLLDRERAPR
jgi:AraC family transcriptional regulator, regulatory protein of adaptative response / methylated-DNA-[protein]-cysteine methyltransferase